MVPESLTVRRYRGDDHDAVMDLHRSALAPVGALAEPGPWDADLDEIEANYLTPGGEFLVGFLDGELVTMGALRRVDPRTFYLKRMRVKPALQRLGIGRYMLELLLDTAARSGCDEVVLDTTRQQSAAIALYRRYGFEQTGTGVVSGMDVLYFRLRLSAEDRA
ncbi:MAG: GNAT family N-acetyltransferase [Actinocatenispora sp.]